MKEMGYGASFVKNFLGNTPAWYKLSILAFLIINPILFLFVSETLAGWVLIAEFIYTLALALKCYPLPSGGLLAIEALILGMTSPSTLLHEVEANLSVILLLMFMVAGIYFYERFSFICLFKTACKSKIKTGTFFNIFYFRRISFCLFRCFNSYRSYYCSCLWFLWHISQIFFKIRCSWQSFQMTAIFQKKAGRI